MASRFGIHDVSEVKEYTELAIVLEARAIAHSEQNLETRYKKIVELYKKASEFVPSYFSVHDAPTV